MKGPYTQASTRDIAVNTLRSWLTACGIQSSNSPQARIDLEVMSKDGTVVKVRLTQGQETAPEGSLAVSADEIKCTTYSTVRRANPSLTPLQIAFQAFHKVTSAAGYGYPIPFDRGEEPEQMATFDEDGWLIPLRHKDFRRSPNPPAAKFEQYREVLERGAYLFYSTNEQLCERNAMGIADINNLARFLLVPFCARYERPNPINDENERLLTAFLRQRFSELRRRWVETFLAKTGGDFTQFVNAYESVGGDDLHRRRMSGGEYNEYEDYRQTLYSEPLEFPFYSSASSDEPLPLITDHDEEIRKTQAKDRLSRALSSMPHDQMVTMLRNIADNKDFDQDTRNAGHRQLILHSRRCKRCRLLRERAQKDEQLSAVDAGSAQE